MPGGAIFLNYNALRVSTPPPTANTYNDRIQSLDPLFFWKAGDTSGALADSSLLGNNPSSSVSGVTYASTIVTPYPTGLKSASIAGGWLLSPAMLDMSKDFTLEFWGTPTSASTWIMAMGDASRDHGVYLQPTGFGFYCRETNGGSYTNTTLSTYTLGAVVHIVATYIASSKQIRLYQNGTIVGSAVTLTNALQNAVSAVGIGRTPTYAPGVSGRFQNVAAYQRALSATEVAKNYELGNTGTMATPGPAISATAAGTSPAASIVVTPTLGLPSGFSSAGIDYDFDNNGVFDLTASTNSSESHVYGLEGVIRTKLRVKSTSGDEHAYCLTPSFTLTSAGNYYATVTADAPDLWHKMNVTQSPGSNQIPDDSGNGGHANMQWVVTTTGTAGAKYGQTVKGWDRTAGGSGVLQLRETSGLVAASAMTLEVAFKCTYMASGWQYLISRLNSWYIAYDPSTGVLRGAFQDSLGTWHYVDASGVTNGVFHHVMVRFDTAVGVTLFLNGVKIGTQTTAIGKSLDTTTARTHSAACLDRNTATLTFLGWIDEMVFYKAALSDTRCYLHNTDYVS